MEEKDLQRLLDMLYGMVDEAKSAPFSAEKCTINRDEALDIITEIRSRMPIEIKKAQELKAETRPPRAPRAKRAKPSPAKAPAEKPAEKSEQQ